MDLDMAIQQPQQYDQEGLEYLSSKQRPVPGQSLASNPDQPQKWEGSPKFTEVSPAIETMFVKLTEPEKYNQLVNIIREGLPIADLAQVLLTDGFQEGLWNADLFTLLIEPAMYMLIGLAEKAGLGPDDYKVYREEDQEPDTPSQQLAGLNRAMDITKERVIPQLRGKGIPSEITSRMKDLKIPESTSLLEPQEPVVTPQESLLTKEV